MDTKTTVTNKADATEAYKAAESALFYADSVTRFLTHRTLKLIDTAISTGNPDALLLRAVRYRDMNENAFQYLCEAMLRGCTQLRIYTNLGLCYYQGNEGVGRDEAKAFECFEKAIQGTFCFYPFCFNLYILHYASDHSLPTQVDHLSVVVCARFPRLHCKLSHLPMIILT